MLTQCFSPFSDSFKNGKKRQALFRQGILDSRWNFREYCSGYDFVFFEFSQVFRYGFGVNVSHSFLEFPKSKRSFFEVPDDEEVPLVANYS